VLVTGAREPIERALAVRLAFALRAAAGRGRPPRIVERLEQLAEQSSGENAGTEVVGLFEEALDYLARFAPEGAGILLIVDELGKFLEYSISHPDRGDEFVLQGLAEAAARARRPFLFLTILHQALDRYAEHVSPGRRAEWAKVQGRFEDVAFEERTEQVVRLLARAVHPSPAVPPSLREAVQSQGQELAARATNFGLRLGLLDEHQLQGYLAASFPLHP
jgi:hypothetical protein